VVFEIWCGWDGQQISPNECYRRLGEKSFEFDGFSLGQVWRCGMTYLDVLVGSFRKKIKFVDFEIWWL